jgi:hypothetical protein
MPFDDDDDRKPKARKTGLKLNNATSAIPQPKVSNAAVFDQKASAAFEKIQGYKQRMWDLSAKFKSFVEDRILSVNKTVISKDLEGEVLQQLITVASEMNEDDTQPEGLGSTALCMLLMKMTLLQRDIINDLGYKVDKLERQLQKQGKPEEK